MLGVRWPWTRPHRRWRVEVYDRTGQLVRRVETMIRRPSDTWLFGTLHEVLPDGEVIYFHKSSRRETETEIFDIWRQV